MVKKKKLKDVKMAESCCGHGICKHSMSKSACGPGVYCLGFIGAAVYYISQATGFWNGVLGFLKAVVWPAFLVYDILRFLGVS